MQMRETAAKRNVFVETSEYFLFIQRLGNYKLVIVGGNVDLLIVANTSKVTCFGF